MGKTTRWFKSLLGMKTHNQKDKPALKTTTNNRSSKMGVNSSIEKRRSFAESNKENVNVNINQSHSNNKWFRKPIDGNDTESTEECKRAIAVAAATAAAADAAVAAAQAAVAVVRLTSHRRSWLFFSGGGGGGDVVVFAAVRIQAFFRGYLARRAHRALKGLVKLQAHVRGFLVRKRAAATLHSMQALIRAQATVRSQRANLTKDKKFHSKLSMEKFDETRNTQFHSKRLSTSYDPYEGSPKIVEIDTFKPKSGSRRINDPNPSVYNLCGDEFQYPTMSSPLEMGGYQGVYEWTVYADHDYCRPSTAQSTPRFANSVRSNGPLTPSKSVCGTDGFFRPYGNHPSYMADTQSFRAKLRSQSAPKQRPDGNRAKKGLSLDEIMAARNSICGVRMQRSGSRVQEGLKL